MWSDSRTCGRACARPSVTLMDALGTCDTTVALLLVVVSRPIDSAESTRFIISEMLHFGSMEVYCALDRWSNPTRKLVSSQVMEKWFASSQTSFAFPPLSRQGNELHIRHTIPTTPLSLTQVRVGERLSRCRHAQCPCAVAACERLSSTSTHRDLHITGRACAHGCPATLQAGG